MNLETIWESKFHGSIKFVFHEKPESFFSHITQSYGLCFNEHREIVLVRYANGNYLLPGGTIEEGETPLETLHREVMEEADLVLDKVHLLGGQKCHYLSEPSRIVNSQLRYVATIKDMQTQTSDPDNGEIPERLLVPIEQVNSYLKWGVIGDFLVQKAKEWYDSL